MSILFRTMKLKEPSFAQKLMRKEPQENGLMKINNLFAQHKNIKELPEEQLYHIIDTYSIQLRKPKSREFILKMYAQLLRDTFVQQHFNEVRLSEILRFKRLFSLNDKDILNVHRRVLSTLFKQEVEELRGSSSSLRPVQRNFLSKLEEWLLLPDSFASYLSKEPPYRFLIQLLQGKGKRKPLDRNNLLEIKALCRSLSISTPDKPQIDHLHKYRLYWCIENGRMPRLSTVPAAIKGESNRLVLAAQWIERRQRLRYTHYGESSLKVKILKGNYWKEALSSQKELAKEVWEVKDKGELYLSTQKLFFVGEKGNRQLLLNKIADFLVHQNGISIQRNNGEEVFFQIPEHVDLMSMLLGRVLSSL